MKRSALSAGIAALMFSTAAALAAADPLADQFANPGPAWRGKPFWSWNGDLQRDELLRQVDILKQMGMGGFVMHSRTGLRTEYLGDDWFRAINGSADNAARLGLEAWLYDEDRWPSGTAGGLVTANPAFRQRFVSLRPLPAADFRWSADLLAAFACRLDGVSYTACQRLASNTPAADFAGKTVLAFTVESMEPSAFFNGNCDVDRLNRDATDYFIRLTHENYRARCGPRLGASIKGLFADEPHRGSVFTGFGLNNTNKLRMAPWTATLPAEFQKRFGQDLVERLPELFLRKDGAAIAPVKWQYMELLQSLFLANWARPIQDWCHANHLAFTGHALHEDSLTAQTAMQGSLMRFYECQDVPGVDVVAEDNRNYWIVKQVASVARQLGQPKILSELYGGTGWQLNFESHKYVGDWQALFGVNLRCHHLSWYTMAGEAKRDSPASISFQSGWWPQYHFVEDYYSRLNLLLAQGRPACDVLVLNPVESVWCQVGVGWGEGLGPRTKEVQDLERAYQEVFAWLAGAQIDFDYGDEEMLGRLGKADTAPPAPAGRAASAAEPAGTLTPSGPTHTPVLRLGQASYRVVVVPKLTTLRSSTLKLLAAFHQAGGKVVFLGDPPAYLDALKSSAPAELAAASPPVAWSRDALVAAVEPALDTPVELLDAATGQRRDQIFAQLRNAADRRVLVALNVSKTQAFAAVRVRLKTSGAVSEWNCFTGQRVTLPTTQTNGWTEFTADFPPVGEHVWMITPAPLPGLSPMPVWREVSRQPYAGPFAYSLNEPNVCVLDLASYQVADGPAQPETELLKVDRAVRQQFGLPWRSGEMVQPWYDRKFGPQPEVKGRVKLSFAFEVETLPTRPLRLGLEEPGQFRAALNGRQLTLGKGDWWVDPAIRTFVLPPDALRPGTNELTLTAEFRPDLNLEALYLLGEFGVRLSGTRKTLTKLPATLAVGDLVPQGLPFYTGTVTYRLPTPARTPAGQSVFLLAPKFQAACLRVKAGEDGEVLIAWQPYEADLTRAGLAGDALRLDAVLTRRNTFGPLHRVPLRAGAYGPGHFVTEGQSWSQHYQLYPSGLLEAPVLCVREPVK